MKVFEFVKVVDNVVCYKLCFFLLEKVMYNSFERCINKNLKLFFINILKIFCYLIFLSKFWFIVRNLRLVLFFLFKRSEINMGL